MGLKSREPSKGRSLNAEEFFHGMAVERLRVLLSPPEGVNRVAFLSKPTPELTPLPAPRLKYSAPMTNDVYNLPVRVLPAQSRGLESGRLSELRRLSKENHDLKFEMKLLLEKTEDLVNENEMVGEEVKGVLDLCRRLSEKSKDARLTNQCTQTVGDYALLEAEKTEAVRKVSEAVKTARESETRRHELEIELSSARIHIEELKAKSSFSTELETRLGSLTAELHSERRKRSEFEMEFAKTQSRLDEVLSDSRRMECKLQKDVAKLNASKKLLENECESTKRDCEMMERDFEMKLARKQNEIDCLREKAEKIGHLWRIDKEKCSMLSDSLENYRRQLETFESYRPKAQPLATPNWDELQVLNQKFMAYVETKNSETASELEKLVAKQTNILQRLKDECLLLTKKLDDAHKKHKEDCSRINEENLILLSRLRDVTTLWDSMQSETDLRSKISCLSGVVGTLKTELRAKAVKESAEET
ncbi:unnamed protein product [Notodromas monacha]|uniref:Uncharacterized protein n=1 Tax=Notodromas monacha TaxID=399045 RepID=A0A7R9BVK0_9CRUS|nr:unnamed protein product [Notodromas monacha]CAG0921575.1 unnamed protein product [Notodromas monacha]